MLEMLCRQENECAVAAVMMLLLFRAAMQG